jgi:hypothetical protein
MGTDIRQAILDAKMDWAKAVVMAPHISARYCHLQDLRRKQDELTKQIQAASKEWLAELRPAMTDPLLRQMAIRDKLVTEYEATNPV